MQMNKPSYTFVSVSTAKPGKLADLVRIAKAPTMKMDQKSDGLLAYQVSVDEERNTVVVWSTYDHKETLYNFLETDQGKDDHGEKEDMESIIDTFVMYDLEPVSGRLLPKSP
jgi:quinol monooxygenase YgiN